MLIIKTYLKETKDKGLGLFSSETLPVNTIVHIDETDFDKKYTYDFAKNAGLLKFFYHYATYEKDVDMFYLCSDNARFINHSESPNIFYDKEKCHCITIKDIAIGEEITTDYRNICDDIKYNGFDFEVY